MSDFKTLPEVLDAHMNRANDDRWLSFIEGKNDEVIITYRELREHALKQLGYFQKKGLKAGDHLIIFLRDNPRFVDAFWAALYGGIVPVPIAVGISDEHRMKLFKVFALLDNAYVYTTADNVERLAAFAKENGFQDQFAVMQDRFMLSDKLTGDGNEGVPHQAQANDTAFIQFSSGSTSDPKGVVLSHRNILLNMHAIATAGGYTQDDIALSWMPLTHDMGLIGFHLNMVFWNMCHCIMATDVFSRRPMLWMQKVNEKRATVLCSPNFGYKHFLKALGAKEMQDVDFSCVRIIINGAEPISTRLCDEFLQRLAPYGLKHTTMLPVYGLAEATLAVSFPKFEQDYCAVHVDRHAMLVGDKVVYLDSNHPDAVSFPKVGFAIQDMAFRIADMDGNVFDDDCIGGIQMKGPTVTQGYYKNPQANQAVFTADGWLDTGDLGFISEGELVVTGRAKEIIFANGQNYYPHDIEAILIRTGEFELGKVVACGQHRDKDQVEELLVFVLFRRGVEDFVDVATRVTHIVNEHMGLEIDQVIPIRQVPKTTSGKLQRRKLGAAYAAGEYDDVLAQLKQVSEPAAETEHDGSMSELEARIKGFCDATLAVKRLSLHDNFFDSGINSLELAEIHQKIEDNYPGVLDVVDLFEYQTISEVAAFMGPKLP